MQNYLLKRQFARNVRLYFGKNKKKKYPPFVICQISPESGKSKKILAGVLGKVINNEVVRTNCQS